MQPEHLPKGFCINQKYNITHMPAMLQDWRLLLPYIIASNLIFLILPIGFHYLLPTYSFQNALLLDPSSPLYYSVSFDGAHFLTNTYEYQKNFAFLPGFTLFTRMIQSMFSIESSIAIILIINKVCTALSSIILYNLVKLLTKNQKVSLVASILFLFNPASVFYHAVYSEAIYALISFTGIYKALKIQTETRLFRSNDIQEPLEYLKKYYPSLALLGFATVFRSTGIFISAIFGIPIIEGLYSSLSQSQSKEKPIKIILTGVMVLGFFLTYTIKYLFDAYVQFCTGDEKVKAEFCNWVVPNIYSYIQDKFWQVGFLVYYQPDKLGPMLFGLPSIVFALVTLNSTKNFGLNLSYWLLLIITIFFSNIHSSARFFSSHPLYYVGMSKFLIFRRRLNFVQLLTLFYLVVYNIFGVVFFPQRFWWV